MQVYLSIMLLWLILSVAGLFVACMNYSFERGYSERSRKEAQRWLRFAALALLITPLWIIGFVFLVGYGVKTLWTWCFE